jgi:hypothetical protein
VVFTTYPNLAPRLKMGYSYASAYPLYLHCHIKGSDCYVLCKISVPRQSLVKLN